ncbi:MAG: hypothetical protein AAB840_01875, partial [Patescibacteria group bacterium]
VNIILSADVGAASPMANDVFVEVSDVVLKSGFAGVYGALLSGKKFHNLTSRLRKMFMINTSLQAVLVFFLISAGFGVVNVVIMMLLFAIFGLVLVPKTNKRVFS